MNRARDATSADASRRRLTTSLIRSRSLTQALVTTPVATVEAAHAAGGSRQPRTLAGRPERPSAGGGDVPRRTAVDPRGGGLGQDPRADPPDRVSDRDRG